MPNDKIDEWLRRLNLSQYAQAFAENDIDVEVLADLTDADFKEIGVASLGHRKRLLAAVAEMRAPAAEKPPEGRTADAGERRQVTILFADLCNFTALSQTLDARGGPRSRGAVHGARPTASSSVTAAPSTSTSATP